MALGKLPVPGRPTIWITVGQGPTALAVGAGGGCLDLFTLIYSFFPLSPSLWEMARYRLKYCLKGPLNPKPTNQPTKSLYFIAGQGSRQRTLHIVERFVVFKNPYLPTFFSFMAPHMPAHPHFTTKLNGWSAFHKDLC